MDPDKPIKIIAVGSMPPPLGGTTVSFSCLVGLLRERTDVDFIVIDTAGMRSRGFRGMLGFLRCLGRMFLESRDAAILTVHVSPTALPFIGPGAWVVSRLTRTPYVVRMFGGMHYGELPQPWRSIAGMVVRGSDLYLAQTRQLIVAAQAEGVKRVEWFPTSRPMASDSGPSSGTFASPCRFAFVGHVKWTKGISEMMEAAQRFRDEVIVDVYGPFTGDVVAEDFTGKNNIRYCGVLPPDQVGAVLSRYDALLLPTYHDGEGYPGVVVEAFSVGIPVICSRWKSLPEMVDEDCGILVQPRDANSLYQAMLAFVESPELVEKLKAGAYRKRKNFDAGHWADCFVEFCRKLAKTKNSKA